MKDSRSVAKNPPETEEAEPYMDEAMAMVYVGDVYSLVAQEGTAIETETRPARGKIRKPDETTGDDHDAVWPFIR